jgi:hypothetical protein
MSRKKLVLAVPKERLVEYGFFHHQASGAYWFVFNTTTTYSSNVELSLRVYDDNDELRMYATNDHIKLPSVYNKKYTKDNYLEIEEELDKYSFEEWIQLGLLFELINDGIIKYVKPVHKYPKKQKPRNIVLDALDKRKKKTLDKLNENIENIITSPKEGE